MNTVRRGCCLLVLLAVILPCAAPAEPVGVRQGRHGDMGRLVFDFRHAERFETAQDGRQLTIRFSPAAAIGAIPLHIPGVETMQVGAGVVQLQLAKGAVSRVYRLGNRVVVDTRVLHAGRHENPAPASPLPLPPPAPPPSVPPAAVLRPADRLAPPAPAQPAPAPAAPQPAASQPAALEPGGPPAAADSPAPPSPAAQPSVPASPPPPVVDFATQPGAAAFRRGGQVLIVFDTPEIPDITALQANPLFARATLLSLQNTQIVSIPLPDDDALSLTPVAGGWQVNAVSAPPPVAAPPQPGGSAVDFNMQSANQSVIIADPLTGGDLLVGTVTQGGEAADYRESGPGYAVLPAWLGVVIVPEADSLVLNASLKGFELTSDAPHGLPLGKIPAAALQAESGSGLGLPRGTAAQLWKRLLKDQRTAALLPPLGRLQAQITLAKDMVALGMGVEAAGVLDTAVLENPAAQYNSRIAAFRAVADVLAHRGTAEDFTAPGIIMNPELVFWRAVARLESGKTAEALPDLAAGLPLFETYPEPLRNTITGRIAEALADGGRLQAARQLTDSDPDNRRLDLARAKILDHEGQAKAALAAYRALRRSLDNRVFAIAGMRMVELQLASGQLNDAQAAAALDAQLFDWRGPEHERHLRLRIAKLRAAAGQWPQAFTMLAQAGKLFPGYRAGIDATRSAMFLEMLKGDGLARLSPIQAVAVLRQNQDLIPQSGDSAQIVTLLAQRLQALNLPGTAAPFLGRLIRGLPAGPDKASLGATLAQVDLQAGSPAAALADLSETAADSLPAGLQARRDMLAARAQAAGGNAMQAVSTLAPAPGAATPAAARALDAQAQIAEQSGQWKQAEQALTTLAQSIPASGPLDPAQESLLLRLATAASHNGDSATLAALNAQYGARVGADPTGQMFQTLTAPPLTGDQSLGDALREISQLQALPAMVNAVAGTAPPNPKSPAPPVAAAH